MHEAGVTMTIIQSACSLVPKKKSGTKAQLSNTVSIARVAVVLSANDPQTHIDTDTSDLLLLMFTLQEGMIMLPRSFWIAQALIIDQGR